MRSDGELVTRRDLRGNELADELAKQGVEFYRVGTVDVKLWRDQMQRAEDITKWIGIATHEVNNFEHYPYKDSEAARWRAEAATRAKREPGQGIDGRRSRHKKKEARELQPHEGGHDLRQVASGKGWFCMTCKARIASRKKLAVLRWGRNATKEWMEPTRNTSQGRRHTLQKSGPIIWCGACG